MPATTTITRMIKNKMGNAITNGRFNSSSPPGNIVSANITVHIISHDQLNYTMLHFKCYIVSLLHLISFKLIRGTKLFLTIYQENLDSPPPNFFLHLSKMVFHFNFCFSQIFVYNVKYMCNTVYSLVLPSMCHFS